MIKFNQKFKARYGTAIYLLAIMGILLCLLICTGVYAVAPEGNSGEVVKTASNLLFQIINLAIFFSFIFWKKTRPDIFWQTGITKGQTSQKHRKFITIFCLCGVLFAVVCLICFAALAEVGQLLLQFLGYKLSLPYKTGIPLQDVFLLVITIVAAPICEELIYRSALTSGLKKKFNDYITAIFVGLAFSLMHMNPEQTIYQFFLGFGSTLLALSSGFIIPSIIMHAVSNLIVALDMINVAGFTHFFDWYQRVFAGSNLALGISAPLLAATGVAAFVLITKLLKKYAKNNTIDALDAATLSQQQTIVESDGEQEEKIKKLDSFGQNDSFFIQNRVALVYFLGIALSLFIWVSVFVSNLA